MLFFKKKRPELSNLTLKESLKKKISSNKENDWATNDHFLFRALDQLIDSFLRKHLVTFLNGNEIILVKVNGEYSCALSYPRNIDLILVFPDLYKLLKCANPNLGVAILAHEFGHLYHRHSEKKISLVNAQI